MLIRLFCILVLLLFTGKSFGQIYQSPSSKILLKIKKLNVLGSALYLAAHPDDENTRLIAYLGNEKLVNTAYLAITRGDGGQNLVGPELREGLGVIRTQELLAARRLDGGQQFFTRANDFGYSKTADETLKIWEKDKVLSDVVWIFRKFRPDVVITRFPADSRAGHGHHTSSAVLAEEAFKIAGTTVYPEQLTMVKPWQPTRIAINSGRWWDKDIESREGVIKIDAGAFNPLLGFSYGEIAASSRSMHKSQGFGVARTRGEQFEYLTVVDGLESAEGLFDGIDISWKRVGKPAITSKIKKIINAFDPEYPEASVSDLFEVRDAIAEVADDYWRKKKLAEVEELILLCSGVFTAAWAKDYTVVPGEDLNLSLELVNRSSLPWQLNNLQLIAKDTSLELILEDNKKHIIELQYKVPENKRYSGPYWLNDTPTIGMYNVVEQKMRGLAENPAAFEVKAAFSLNSHTIIHTIPVVYRWTERVNGEMVRPVAITPPVFVNISSPVNIFTGRSKSISLSVTAGKPDLQGNVSLSVPSGWKVNPEEIAVTLTKKWDVNTYQFVVTPPDTDESGTIIASVTVDGKTYSTSLKEIRYDHIPYQMLLPQASSRVENLTITSNARTIGYIMGAGDAVPAALEQLGIKVWFMHKEDITSDNLSQMDAIILGIRAVNTLDWLPSKKDELMEYVKNGGTMITQYNTSRRIKWQDFAPYELTFTGRSADSRISEETSEISILAPDHPVLNRPNSISSKDFEGWVQERGLYFPSAWDSHYEAVLSGHDTGKEPLDGGLLIAAYGKGYYVYTGYSWFRELPAGVPGAFRLFANIISLGNTIPAKNIQTDKNE